MVGLVLGGLEPNPDRFFGRETETRYVREPGKAQFRNHVRRGGVPSRSTLPWRIFQMNSLEMVGVAAVILIVAALMWSAWRR